MRGKTLIWSVMALALGVGCAGLGYAAPQVGSPSAAPSEPGKTLTPYGAVKAGNAAGTIPAWTGGLTTTPANVVSGFKPGVVYPDPFAADKPLFTITSANVDQYKDHLTVGQLALFKTYPDYKMIIYLTHRTAAYPQGVYEASIANAATGRAKLVTGNGSGVIGTTGGVPFPIPKNGLEVIWNQLTAYHGEGYETNNEQAAVTRSGAYSLVNFQYRLMTNYGSQTIKPADRAKNLIGYFIEAVTGPARLAGNVLLVLEPLDQTIQQRKAWTYNPGQRRIRLAPDVAYDNPGTDSDGMRTTDDWNMFNGSPDRYDWKLLGKREIYVPYNDYRMASHAVTLKELLTPKHLNTNYIRYELHRVWVVQATLKQGMSHVYGKRTFYLDEDSWNILALESYDGRGNLWRVGEEYPIQEWDIPALGSIGNVMYDLQAGRYIAYSLVNDSNKIHVKTPFIPADFTPLALRQSGVR